MINETDILHNHWIEIIETEGKNLSKWEQDFIQSLRDRIDTGRSLSEKQAAILERIYADKTP